MKATLPHRLILACMLTGCFGSGSHGAEHANPYAEAPPVLRLPKDVRPLAYTLELTVLPQRERFRGRTQIAVALDAPKQVIWLHGKDLNVKSVRARSGGETISGSYHQQDDDGLASLRFESALPAGRSLIELVYDAAFDRQLQGLYRVDTGGDSYAFTQFESISARKAFPCFDEPGWKTPFDVWLTVSTGDVAVSNTQPVEQQDAGAFKRVHFAQTKPLPTYLVALAVGPLDVVQVAPLPPSDLRSEPIPLRGIATRGRGGLLAHTLSTLAPTLAALERYFGIAYPYDKLDIVAVPDFAAGAMENAGLVTFRDSLILLDPQQSGERDRRSSAFVLAHELAHQWFGDLVTMRYWDDIWLNEAFATWMEYRIVSELHPEYKGELELTDDMLEAMESDSRVTARMIRQPITSTHDILNAFDSITYSKGGGVIGMFERYIGAGAFQQGIQAYLKEHAFGNGSTEDLLAALSKSAGHDVAVPFSSFLTQAGVPLVEAELSCTDSLAQLQLRQSRYLPLGSVGDTDQRWQIPICARYETGGALRENCSLLTNVTGSIPLAGGGCPSWVMPNADGAGYYRFTLSSAELGKLRTQGLQTLSARERYVLARALQAGFEAGNVSASDLLGSMPAFAADDERVVATAPIEYLRFLRNQWLGRPGLSDAQRGALRVTFESYVKSLYAPLGNRLGFHDTKSESGDVKLLREQALAGLSDIAADPLTRSRLAQAGNVYMGLDSDRKLHPSALPNDLADLGVRMLVEDGDDLVFDAAYEQLTHTDDATLRSRFLRALSSVRDERSPRALALALDPALKVSEVLTPLHNQLADYRTRDAAYAWFEQNFDALLKRVSPSGMGNTPWFATVFCDQNMSARIQAFFAPRIDKLPGGPRSLGGALETLGLCDALIKAQSESLDAFFTAR